jgi:hypothetical protein
MECFVPVRHSTVLVASAAQLAEQLTLNFANVFNGFVTVCSFVISRDFIAQLPWSPRLQGEALCCLVTPNNTEKRLAAYNLASHGG